MAHLYTALGEPLFAHDFDNVEYEADEFDLALGAPGLHSIRRKVDWIERQTVLPPELFRRFDGDMFWRHPEANIRGASIIQIDG
jgi:sulfotransferase